MNPNSLTLDERDVLNRQPGTFIPRRLGRAHWRLVKEGIARDARFYNKATPCTLLRLTDDGSTLRAKVVDGVDDPDAGWGIMFIDGGADLWWCPDGGGYTTDISYAGLYSRDRAHRQNGFGRCGKGRDMSVPPARMRELLDDEIAKTQTRLERLLALQKQIPA